MFQHTRETLIASITDAIHELTEEQLRYIHGICWRFVRKSAKGKRSQGNDR